MSSERDLDVILGVESDVGPEQAGEHEEGRDRLWLYVAGLVVLAIVAWLVYQSFWNTPGAGVGTSGGDAQTQVEAAQSLMDAGQYAEAIALLKQVIARDPASVEAHFLLGNAYANTSQLVEAAQAFKTVISLDPSNADAHSNLGVVYYRQGQLPEAAAEFELALSLSPDDAEIHYNLGGAYFQMGKLDEAIAQFEKALELNPDLPQPYFGMGNAYKLQGNREKAIESFEKFLQMNPSPELKAEAERQLKELKGS